MNFRQLAMNNVIGNRRTYIAHFLSSAFAVMVFFIYALLLFHPELKAGDLGGIGGKAFLAAQLSLLVFSFLLLFYSAGAFLKVRKKEIGILLLLGMSPKQMKKLIYTENMVVGLAAVCCGILAGLVFTKLYLLIFTRMFYLPASLPFYLPVGAVAMTGGAFLLLFVVLSFFTAQLSRNVQVAELINADVKPKPEPRASGWLAVLAVLLILAGYGMAFCFLLLNIRLLALLLLSVLCVGIGTYLFFTQTSVFTVRRLKRRPRIYYRKINLLTLTELTYRMKDNAVMFFMVASILAGALTAFGTTMALTGKQAVGKENPYAITYESLAVNPAMAENVRLIEQTLSANGIPYRLGKAAPKLNREGQMVVSFSDYRQLAAALGLRSEPVLEDAEFLDVTWDSSIQAGNLLIGAPVGENLVVRRVLHQRLLPSQKEFFVVTDRVYQQLPTSDWFGEAVRHYFVVEKWEDTVELAEQLAGRIESNERQTFSALGLEWLQLQRKNAGRMIISGLVGVVCFTFAASFLYFRLYADLERDEKQFQMMAKIGLSRTELKRVVTRQMLLMFFLPITVAFVHSAVALSMIALYMNADLGRDVVVIFSCCLGIQILYYVVVRWRYLRRLYQKVTV